MPEIAQRTRRNTLQNQRVRAHENLLASG
jgi:hypothetical protein